VGALVIAVVMLNALVAVHWRNGYWNVNGGYEYNLLIWLVAVALAAIGGARFSFDRLLGWDNNISGLWWGVAVLVLSLLVAAVTLTLGRHQGAPGETAASGHDAPVRGAAQA
jgi:hypothetical protein